MRSRTPEHRTLRISEEFASSGRNTSSNRGVARPMRKALGLAASSSFSIVKRTIRTNRCGASAWNHETGISSVRPLAQLARSRALTRGAPSREPYPGTFRSRARVGLSSGATPNGSAVRLEAALRAWLLSPSLCRLADRVEGQVRLFTQRRKVEVDALAEHQVVR